MCMELDIVRLFSSYWLWQLQYHLYCVSDSDTYGCGTTALAYTYCAYLLLWQWHIWVWYHCLSLHLLYAYLLLWQWQIWVRYYCLHQNFTKSWHFMKKLFNILYFIKKIICFVIVCIVVWTTDNSFNIMIIILLDRQVFPFSSLLCLLYCGLPVFRLCNCLPVYVRVPSGSMRQALAVPSKQVLPLLLQLSSLRHCAQMFGQYGRSWRSFPAPPLRCIATSWTALESSTLARL